MVVCLSFIHAEPEEPGLGEGSEPEDAAGMVDVSLADGEKKEAIKGSKASSVPKPKMKYGEEYNPNVVSLYGLNAPKQAPKPNSSSEGGDASVVSLSGQGEPKPPTTRYSEGYNPSVVHLF